MKKILIALSLFMMVGVAANAQTAKCAKGAKSACCAKKASASADATPATRVASAMTEADIAAESNENITARTCAESGSKSYYMKSVCEKSGAVAWDQVNFCDKSKKFTKVASASMEKDAVTGEVKAAPAKKACSKGAKSACCASKKKVG